MGRVSGEQILEFLDPEQRQVATSLDSPVVVLAGAGTGKTRAITHRVAYAVAEGRYQASAVLAVTFTTRAAGEMRSRLAQLGVRSAQARTIHAAALRQCQFFWPKVYGAPFPPLADNTFSLVARAAHQVTGGSDTALVRDLDTEIGWAKTSNVTPSRYAEIATGRVVSGLEPARVGAVFAAYEKLKTDSGVVDFNDLLLCNAVLLSEHPAAAEEIRSAYRHFVVDEYQDVSALQHRLISLWVDGRDDVCVVGDPNQAIHSFAGADPGFLLGFADEHPGAKTIHLVRNYRSTPQILGVGTKVLRPSRTETLRPTQAPGPMPILDPSTTERFEAEDVAEWLRQRAAAGTAWAEMAVLYRINAQAPALEAALSARDVPYTVRGSERFYERAEVRQAVTGVQRAAETAPDQPALEALDGVLAQLGWTTEPPSGQGRQRERWESLTALRDTLREEALDRDDRDGWSLGEAAAWLGERASWQHSPVAAAVTLSTMHAAKGLEWDDVAIVGLREGLVPFVLSQEEPALSEERRLLYVAITRARRQLRLSWAWRWQGGQSSRSRFLAGIGGPAAPRDEAPRQRATSLKSRPCKVCGALLHSATERKLGRHEDCEVAYDEELLASLKAWRKTTAEEAKVPAFVVFTDATLQAIAESVPRSVPELLKLPGIGKVKADRYGQACLDVVLSHS
ncbi:ATP-dependent DNA helicase UvrD2 [Tessaracoccus caeni]|uniref:ATP-dependent DNA helicase UvrD2 n=1 Tax=Tessaracoccus caeni TaxID=3031239 RepID=UPI0023DB78B5|nr:ATP-dependent DNA helicase UvrD2 [Tessaracoccus caeni]MDF1486791.1 ATP-dependent DNA helicase UvrD2 [Tessaracoccus caeni]